MRYRLYQLIRKLPQENKLTCVGEFDLPEGEEIISISVHPDDTRVFLWTEALS